nr:MAG TPA: hypothetical protein [Caudoviricetes sp.]
MLYVVPEKRIIDESFVLLFNVSRYVLDIV